MTTTDRPTAPGAGSRIAAALAAGNDGAIASSVPSVQNELVLFAIRGRAFAVAVAGVSEILRPSEVTPLPRLPRYILGVVNRSGRVTPVLDLAMYIGFESELAPRRMVVLADGELEAAVPITAIHSIATVDAAAIQASFAEVKERQPFVVGQIERGEVVYSVLDVGRLLRLSSCGREG
ncbi:MAG: chemotaxis protein CheW [Deltaproteobacteria bacterium]|nr:chemotaxis protein CheW [Deltaproteobacteria bacterium]